jgi:hypothetical protein
MSLIEEKLKNDFNISDVLKLFSDKKLYNEILELNKIGFFKEVNWLSMYTIPMNYVLIDFDVLAQDYFYFIPGKINNFELNKFKKIFLLINWIYLNAQMIFVSEFRAIKTSILMFEHIREFNNWEIPYYLYTSDQIEDKKILNINVSNKIKKYYFEQKKNHYYKILELIGYEKLFQQIDQIINNSEDESNENFYNINYIIGNKS